MKYSRHHRFALLAAFLLLGWVTGCNPSESNQGVQDKANSVRTVKVGVEEVVPTPMRDVLLLPGETEAWQDVLVPADTGGTVEWIGPREGDPVKQGELVAKIDVASLKAALDRAQAAYDLAVQLSERREQLYERKIINKEELDKTLTEETLAEGNLRQARVEYERGFLKSPITGMVNDLFVDEGEFVDRGSPFMEVVHVDKIKVNVNVPELDVRYIEVDTKALVTIDAFPGRQIIGTIEFVAYKADPATKTFHVQVVVENPEHDIRPGMIARVAFLRRIIDDAVAAPLFALVDKGGERLVYVVEDGVAHARTVTIGVIEGDRVQITKGLEPGDKLIVTGQTEVEEGMRVEVQ
jgi:membrane fusion protein (multidrug efflux system)